MALLKRRRAGLGDAMDVVTRFVNACNRHDADGVYACLHPDFDSIQPMYPSRNFRGADQVRRNWQAIFDAEPGFRLTVLRSAAVDDTIWLELHGAGQDAEVAGVFVMGVQGDRIRWARIYSALVEPVPAGAVEEPAPGTLREVPAYQESASAPAGGDVVEEALIAPVLEMERSGRRRRRGRRGAEEDAPAVAEEPAAVQEIEAVDEPAVEAVDEPAAEEPPAEEVEVAVVNADAAAVDVTDAETVVVVDTTEDTEVVIVTDEPAPAAADDDDGPATEAVDMVVVTEEPDAPPEVEVEAVPDEVVVVDEPVAEAPEPVPDPDPEPDPPRGFFGRKRS